MPLLGPSSFFLSMSFFLHQFLSLIALALCHWQTPHLNSNSSSFFTLRFFFTPFISLLRLFHYYRFVTVFQNSPNMFQLISKHSLVLSSGISPPPSEKMLCARECFFEMTCMCFATTNRALCTTVLIEICPILCHYYHISNCWTKQCYLIHLHATIIHHSF